MSVPLPIAQQLNHAAFPTGDTGATYRFYTQVLGLELVAAVQAGAGSKAKGVEKLPEESALHTFFALGNGECLAFFDIPGFMPEPNKDGTPIWARHIAFSVGSRDELQAWRRRLTELEVPVSDVVDHDGVWYSIYFPDPNGLLLELTYQSRELTERDAEEAEVMVRAWAEKYGQSLTE